MVAVAEAVIAKGPLTWVIPVKSANSFYMWDTLGGNGAMVHGGERGV